MRAGEISAEEVKAMLGLAEDTELPDVYNIDKLTSINKNAVGWFDEVHRDCFVGELGSKVNQQFQFRRNEKGELDENGTFNDPAKECSVKYNSQCRL